MSRTRGDMEQLSKELGVNCFKLFMSQKGRLMLDNTELMEAFKHIRDIGGVAKVSIFLPIFTSLSSFSTFS